MTVSVWSPNIEKRIKIPKIRRNVQIRINKNSLILTAAFAGLIGGTVARAAQPSSQGQSSSLSAGQQASSADDKKAIEKHACKGMNSCKGNGGGSAKEYGKNSCKGQGACATDGFKK